MTGAPRIAVALLVRPGADAGPATAALRAARVPEVDVVVLERPGAWAAARNAALQTAADADVLAFVQDDVLVGPGWGVALAGAWDDARLAVAGGPVRPRGAPGWLRAADHGEVLGLAGRGDGAPDGPGFHGGNVAFRVAALRGVGGFFPARGHADVDDGLGEDRLAQQELAAAGWRAVGLEGLAAERDLRDLTPAALVRRRLLTGARRAVLTPAGRAGAARLAVRAGAAAAVRGLRGDRDGALDRAAWAAGGAGGLLGGVIAHRGLQPDRASTALRPAVPAPAPPRLSRLRGRRPARDTQGAILLYHRVAEVPDPLGLAVTPAHFAEQLAALRARWTPVSLDALLAGDGGPDAVAVTFDDGYHDNLVHALPALADAGVPATLFASTGHVASGEGFWWDEVTRLLAEAGAGVLALPLPGGVRAWAPADARQRDAVRAHVHAALQTRDRATIATALAALRAWAGYTAAPAPPPERDRPLTVDELRALAAAGPFSVQAHGRSHVSLAHATAAVRAEELRGGADDLEGWLATRPQVFSYPFGVPGVDVDGATRAAALTAGYRAATANAPGLVRRGGDRFALPRLAAPDVGGAAFTAWLGRALPGRR